MTNISKYRGVGLLLLLTVVAVGSTSTSLFAQARGYASNDTYLKPGMLVRLSSDGTADRPTVERGDNEDPQKNIGVATTANGSGVIISSGNQEVLVVDTGEVDAYVSDLEGPIKKGDLITASPLKGIFAKAADNSLIIFGTALEDFTGKQTESFTVKSGDGEKTVLVAKIRINFDRKPGGFDKVDSSLERLGKSIVGKDISEIRVITGLIVFLVVLVAEAGILYGSISSAITSLGRNPLAKDVIKYELLRVIAVAIIVLVIGLLAIYAILWV